MSVNFVLVSRVKKALLKKSNAMRLSQLRALPKAPGRVVFLGDVLAHDGLWNEWFPGLPTLNNGFTASGVQDALDRLDSTVVAPAAVIVMFGHDDLMGMGRSRSPNDIAEQVQTLMGRLHGRFPDALLLITGVPPAEVREHRDAVVRLNVRLRDLAAGTHRTYVDLFPALADPDGLLRPEFSRHGLDGHAYQAIAATIEPHLAALKEATS